MDVENHNRSKGAALSRSSIRAERRTARKAAIASDYERGAKFDRIAAAQMRANAHDTTRVSHELANGGSPSSTKSSLVAPLRPRASRNCCWGTTTMPPPCRDAKDRREVERDSRPLEMQVDSVGNSLPEREEFVAQSKSEKMRAPPGCKQLAAKLSGERRRLLHGRDSYAAAAEQ